MALTTGPVAIGYVGVGTERRPTAVGETMTVMDLLRQRAEPGAIPQSTTARLVTGYIRLEALGSAALPGTPEAGPVFNVVGVGPRRSPSKGSVPGP